MSDKYENLKLNENLLLQIQNLADGNQVNLSQIKEISMIYEI